MVDPLDPSTGADQPPSGIDPEIPDPDAGVKVITMDETVASSDWGTSMALLFLVIALIVYFNKTRITNVYNRFIASSADEEHMRAQKLSGGPDGMENSAASNSLGS